MWLWFLVGLVIGSIITVIVMCKLTVSGVLRIDHSNPEKDIYRFDVDDIDRLSKKKRITLSIDNNADLSRK